VLHDGVRRPLPCQWEVNDAVGLLVNHWERSLAVFRNGRLYVGIAFRCVGGSGCALIW
jgi:hypothetical protein